MNVDGSPTAKLDAHRSVDSFRSIESAPQLEASQVPEASTWALFLVAAAMWLLRLRRRTSRRQRGG